MESSKTKSRVLISALAAGLIAACLASCEDPLKPLYLPKAGDGVEILALHSAVVGADYTVYVGLPADYGSTSAPYPMIVLTDADANFSTLRNEAMGAMARGDVRNSIIVGIGYGLGKDCRQRDYTPTRDTSYEAKHAEGLVTGGADAFLAFIADELCPYIEGRYRVLPGRDNRCFLGHSLGGLLGLYASIARPGLFGAIVASSPSLYWDSRVLFRFLAQSSGCADFPGLLLFASSAEHEGFPSDVELDEWIRRSRALPAAVVLQRRYSNQVHMAVWERAWQDGLVAVFGEE